MKSISARILASVAVAALSAGCSSVFNGPEHALSIAEEHPIAVDSQVVTLTVELDGTLNDLSAVDKARIRAFTDAYLRNGHGTLTVTAPSGAANDRDGQRIAADIRKHLYDLGVDWSRITGATYRSGESRRQLILSYAHYVATAPACGNWTRSRDFRNLRSPNFGCATQNNIAAMVSDPRDLVQPADGAPADATARIRAMNAYRAGEVTASQTDSAIQAEVSN